VLRGIYQFFAGIWIGIHTVCDTHRQGLHGQARRDAFLLAAWRWTHAHYPDVTYDEFLDEWRRTAAWKN
jgi:hypothetical protein